MNCPESIHILIVRNFPVVRMTVCDPEVRFWQNKSTIVAGTFNVELLLHINSMPRLHNIMQWQDFGVLFVEYYRLTDIIQKPCHLGLMKG